MQSLTTCEVLDVSAEAENFLATVNELGTGTFQLPGLYMIIKAQNFNITVPDDAVVERGQQEYSSDSESYCNAQINYPVFVTDTSVTPNVDTVYDFLMRGLLF